MNEKIKKIAALVFVAIVLLYVSQLIHYGNKKLASRYSLGTVSIAKAEDDERENEEYKEDEVIVESESEPSSPKSDKPEESTPPEENENNESFSSSVSNNSDVSTVQSEEASTLGWYIIRSAGITSYILMFLMVVMGEGMTSGIVYKFVNPIRSWVVHKYLGIMLGVALLVHMTSLLFDKFVTFGFLDILIPFHSDFKPIFVSLGIGGFYLMVAVILSSLMFRERRPYLWRRIHWLVYILFIFGFIHGVFLGTDSHTLIMQTVFWSTGIIYFIVLSHRWVLAFVKMQKWKKKIYSEDL